MDEVGYYAGIGGTFVSDGVSRRDEAVPDSSTGDDTHFDFIVNMLPNNEVSSEEEDTGTNLCEIRGHLPTQETELKLQTEAVDIRALSARDLRKKVDESDNLSLEQKGRLFHTLSKTGLTLHPSQAYVNYLSMNSRCNVQSPLLAIHNKYHFQSGQLPKKKKNSVPTAACW